MMRSRINTVIALSHDLIASAIAWGLAYLLRFNFEMPDTISEDVWRTMVWVVPLQGIVFWGFGLYRGIWRYASVADFRRILLATLVASASIPLVQSLLHLDAAIPRSIMIIDLLLLLVIMGGDRLLYRLWKENLLYGDSHQRGEPVLIMGAGRAGIGLVRELMRSQDWHPVGFLDDDRAKHGRTLSGINVLGGIDDLAGWAKKLQVCQIIVAMPSASHQQRKHVIDLASQENIKALTVPAFDDLLSGRVAVSQLREIELDDLLGRDPVELDDAGLSEQLTGKVVLVTGGGGSIGSELCRQLARFAPGKLVLFESSEFALYNIEQELQRAFPYLEILYLAGDVRDPLRIDQVFAQFRPDVVFHAAAYKHVPLMEKQNAWQAVRNNVMGTWLVGEAACRYNVDKFVLISTDKAVNPTNVMGATKRLAEIVCQGLGQGQKTRFVVVRFGNVLGSNGSVIPKFKEQIATGGPITVTHPDITRFFMSIPEAAQLLMQAGCMGKGGEIFVLDMGESVKIVDLARDMIRLSGLTEEDIRIKFTGLRPGEKLYEELLADSEHTLETPHPKLRIAQARCIDDVGLKELRSWVFSEVMASDDEVRAKLQLWVPEYASPHRS